MLDLCLDPITLQQLLDRITKVETNSATLKDIVVVASSLSLKLCNQLKEVESENQTLCDIVQSLHETINDLKQHLDNSLTGIQTNLKDQFNCCLQQNPVTDLNKIQDALERTMQMMVIHDLKVKQEELDKKTTN